jgi:hypothetical protein
MNIKRLASACKDRMSTHIDPGKWKGVTLVRDEQILLLVIYTHCQGSVQMQTL